jgi:hypothetical protein
VGGFSIGVRPQLIDLTGPAGAKRSFDVYVRNFDTLRPAKVWLWPAAALQSSTGALDMEEGEAYEYSAARWLKLSKSELLIRPASEEKVTVTLTVPGDAKGSGHALIVASGAPPRNVPIPPNRENQAYVVTRVSFGIILHYAVPGTARPGAKIESLYLTADPPPNSGLTKATSPYKYWLVTRVRNTGNVMIYGYGWALLRREHVGLVERWRLGEREYGSRKVIYPGRYQDVYLPVSRPLPTGDYRAQVRLDYAPQRAATAEAPLSVVNDNAAADAFRSQTGAFATQTIGLAVTVDQELMEVSVAPGGVRTGTIRVTNNEAVPLVVDTALLDVTMDGDGVLLPLDAPSTARAVGSWLKVAPTQFALPPGKSRRVAFSVAPAREMPQADDLVGLVRFRARALDAVTRTIEGETIGETGVLLVTTLAGRGERKGEIGVLRVDVRPELQGVVRLGVPVLNTGSVHFTPVVNLQLAGRDNPAFQLEKTRGSKSDPVLVLPGKQRLVWFELPRSQLQPGKYDAAVTLDYGGSQVFQRTFTVNLHDAATTPDAPAGKPAAPAKPDQPDHAPSLGSQAGGATVFNPLAQPLGPG